MPDGGSQRFLCDGESRVRKGAEEVATDIGTFGSDNTTLQTVKMTRVAISLKNGDSVHVLFSIVPLICEPTNCLHQGLKRGTETSCKP